MSDSEYYQTIPNVDKTYGSGLKHSVLFGFNSKDYENSRRFLLETIKYAMLYGADKALLTRNSSARRKGFNQLSSSIHYQGADDCKACEKKTKAKYCVQKDELSKIVKFPSRGYSDFPLNLMIFTTMFALRLFSIQFSIFASFLTFPIRLSFCLMMFPIRTLMGMKRILIIRLSRMWVQLISHSSSYLYTRLIGNKSIMNVGLKLSRALIWSAVVCFMLVGLLFSGFLVGGIVMRRLVEEPIWTTETLNFDYTKDSPVAFVPINVHNHKLQLAVALTMPESEYNRNLGMFQVRLESLSANGKMTASSSHACMLKFKSAPIRFVETVFRTAPLIAGFQTESQVLKIKIRDLPKGSEPSGYLKVALEPRAEYNAGAGIPQIYDASLTIQTELSALKKIIWFWRWAIFVWISFIAFWTELATVLIFLRFYVMPRGKAKVEKEGYRSKISWFKSS